MPTTPSPSAGVLRRDIQGLRAVAVVAVIVFHLGAPLPGGFVGVDIFFVVSGFVITAMLMRELDRTGRIDLRAFYIRRFKRLTPALALVIGVTVAVSLVLLSPLGPVQNAAATGWGAIFLLANLVIDRTTGGYFDKPAESNPLLHTWSLSVEEQFYLVFPMALALVWRFSRPQSRRPAAITVVATLAVVSFIAAVMGSRGVDVSNSAVLSALNFLLGFYSPLTRAFEFAAGALLALSLSAASIERLTARTTTAAAWSGLALLAGSFVAISADSPFPGVITLLPVAATLLLILAGSGATPAPIVTRLLAGSPAVYVGALSYSLYLWHWPFIVLVGRLVPGSATARTLAAIVSVGAAYASYRWVEQPIRTGRVRPGRPLARLVAATALPPLLLSGIALGVARAGYWSPTVKEFQAATLTPHVGERAGGDTFLPLSRSLARRCVWNGAQTGSPIYLVGDSNGNHFGEAVVGAATILGRPAVISTTSNCPFIDGYLTRQGTDSTVAERCHRHVTESLRYLTESAVPGVVVIANADHYWTSTTVAFGATPAPALSSTEKKLQQWRVAMSAMVTRLQRAGHQVALVQAIPHWSQQNRWDPVDCSAASLVLVRGGCDATVSLVSSEQQDGATRAAIASLAEAAGVGVIDPGPTMCPSGTCSVRGPGFIRLSDSGHISAPQSRALAPLFADVIGRSRTG